jgi:hypothetical protein
MPEEVFSVRKVVRMLTVTQLTRVEVGWAPLVVLVTLAVLVWCTLWVLGVLGVLCIVCVLRTRCRCSGSKVNTL